MGTDNKSRKDIANSPRNTTGRPRPMAPKAGTTIHRSRYGKGGEYCK